MRKSRRIMADNATHDMFKFKNTDMQKNSLRISYRFIHILSTNDLCRFLLKYIYKKQKCQYLFSLCLRRPCRELNF